MSSVAPTVSYRRTEETSEYHVFVPRPGKPERCGYKTYNRGGLVLYCPALANDNRHRPSSSDKD